MKVVVNKGFATIFNFAKNGVKMIVFSDYLVKAEDYGRNCRKHRK